MDIVYRIFILWFIILIGYIIFLKIIGKTNIIDKFKSYVSSHMGIELKTQNNVNFIIHWGIYCILCVIPMLVTAWEFVGLMSFGLCFLYVGLGIYFRPHIFSDESVYDEPVNFGVAGIPGKKNMQCIGYLDLLSEPLMALSLTALIMAIQFMDNMTEFPYNLWLFILVLFEFFNASLLIFPEKVNEHFDYDIRSQKGYSVYGPISIFWQLIPLILWTFTPK